jgi:dipeptidyl aminopeptidase/acylaminoacyl peptidase/mono/diheme cytochrome c family protein
MMPKSPMPKPLFIAFLVFIIVVPLAGLLVFVNQWRSDASSPPPIPALHHAPKAFTVSELSSVATLPTDKAALLAGRELYVAQCLYCHGALGDGKSEYALGADAPLLPDLRAHMIPGVHTDGLIAAWISNGIPGTSMPGYNMVMSQQEIVQITAYLRTFSQSNPLVGVDPAALATEQARPPTPTPIPDVSEPLPRLTFIRDNNLWYSAGDGTAAVALTHFDAQTLVQSPAFSPDGTQIAFLTLALPTDTQPAVVTTLQSMRADGSNVQTHWQSTTEGARSLVWSRQGDAIFMTRVRTQENTDGSYTQHSEIVRLATAGGPPQLVLERARDVTFSPDGRTMAYVRVADDGLATTWELAERNGQPLRTLPIPANTEEVAVPRFSPDGSMLIVAMRGVFATAQPRQHNDTPTVARLMNTIFAPATAEAHGTPWDIWAVDIASSELRRVTTLAEDEPHAVFSPDGSEIALLGVTGLYRLERDGAQLRRIDSQGSYGGLDWAAP